MVKVSLAILIIPLISFLVNGLFVYGKNRLSSYLSIALMLLTIVCSAVILYSVGSEVFTSEIDWFVVGGQTFSIGLLIDFSGAVMLAVISIVSFLVHLYSLLYMAKDSGYTRYFAFLGLFTFAINGIVLADNLLVVFVFWELVGLSSYLLIGHWYQKDSASKAAKKAFIVNRIGDAGFIAALCILWSQFGTFHLLELETLMSNSVIKDGLWVSDIGSLPEVWLTVLGVGLFMAAMGKSAQFPLQVWLPDAMEGPTPVSALIHAATMVAAGVFLMSRVFVLLDMDSLLFVAIVGSLTAFMGAVAALAQNDIKKVLAFSTISQLGYMIMGVGVGAYDAALFHLFTHAFFKAALFLAAGSVIYSLHELAHEKGLHFDAQDMRNMGEIKKALPVTFYTYFMAACALVGVPLFSGFLSKDALLVATINWSNEIGHLSYLIPILAFASVALTSFYMMRQFKMVFLGKFRGPVEVSCLKEGGWPFKLSLSVLASLSIAFFWSLNPADYEGSWFMSLFQTKTNVTLEFNLSVSNTVNHTVVGLCSTLLVLLGAIISWFTLKNSALSSDDKKAELSFWQRLSLNNWYLNELYSATVLKFTSWLARTLTLIESKVIDRLVNLLGWVGVVSAFILGWLDRVFVDGLVNVTAFLTGQVGGATRSFQYGKVQSFVIFALVSLLMIIFFIL